MHGRRLRVKDKGLTPAEEAGFGENSPDEEFRVATEVVDGDFEKDVREATAEERVRDDRVSVVIVDRNPDSSFTCLSQNFSWK